MKLWHGWSRPLTKREAVGAVLGALAGIGISLLIQTVVHLHQPWFFLMGFIISFILIQVGEGLAIKE